MQTEQQIDSKTFKEIMANYNKSANAIRDIRFKIQLEKIISTEKIGIWSGAAISLSFTLIGYFISNDVLKSFLAVEIYHQPLVVFLIIGWISLLVSIGASSLVRLSNSFSLIYIKLPSWKLKRKLKLNEIHELLPDPILSNEESLLKEEFINDITTMNQLHEDLETESKKISENMYIFINYCVAHTVIGYLIGILFLGFFLIVITYKTVLI